jgi:hypothetical protein
MAECFEGLPLNVWRTRNYISPEAEGRVVTSQGNEDMIWTCNGNGESGAGRFGFSRIARRAASS